MKILSNIKNEYKPLTLKTKVSEVKELFRLTDFNHFAVISNENLVGVISKSEIENIEENDKEIGSFHYLLNLFFTFDKNINLFDILKIFSSNSTNIIPVTSPENRYLGYIDLSDILYLYNETPFVKSKGIVLLIEKEIKDFSFSEVCQIIETNNGKVYGLFISDSSIDTVVITVKFDSQDINEIIQSFRRYNYKLISNHSEDFYFEELKERSDYLQKYINI